MSSRDRRTVAVVGAGLAGLSCARALAGHGLEPCVLEKSRGSGGRSSTRRVSLPQGEATFDHGAQYFTVESARFREALTPCLREGSAAVWPGRFGVLDRGRIEAELDGPERFVGAPGMSSLPSRLGRDLDVRHGVRVSSLRREGGAWEVVTAEHGVLGPFDEVVLAVPAPQALPLVAESARLTAAVQAVEMSPCWAVMVALMDALPLALDGAFVKGSALTWIARDSSKPGRPPGERWVLHAGPEWSRARREDDGESVASSLLEAFAECVGLRLPPTSYLATHRWLFTRGPEGPGPGCLRDEEIGLSATGDWCEGGRIEGAFLAGAELASRILGSGPR